MAEFDTVVAGGLLVTGKSVTPCDIGILDGRVSELGSIEASRGQAVLDATGLLVLPGAVDEHIHPVYLDDPTATSIGAASGGSTTLMHFAYPEPGQGMLDAAKQLIASSSHGVLDFAVHATLFDPATQAAEIGAMAENGIRSFKVFLAYATQGRMTDDYELLRVMDRVAEVDGLVMIHAENGLAIDYLEREAAEGRRLGSDDVATWTATRPPVLEAEAVYRAIAIAEVAGCDVFIAHVTCERALEVVRRARADGAKVVAETCPHYLTLTEDLLREIGALAKVGPPLRTAADIEALWTGLRTGVISAIGSDHAPKKTPSGVGAGVLEAGFGAPSVETLLPVIYDEAINRGRLSLPELVRVVSENPARMFGLFPKKGALLPGSDADLVLWDPTHPNRITAKTQHSNAGYTMFEGRECLGMPRLVMQRGRTIVREGELAADCGHGEFLATGPFDVLANTSEGDEAGRQSNTVLTHSLA